MGFGIYYHTLKGIEKLEGNFKKLKKSVLVWASDLHCKGRISDKSFSNLIFWKEHHRLLNLRYPKSFNEKIQWLKLYDRKKAYIDIVDKVKFKNFVADRLGEEYVIPTLAVWDSPDEITLEGLPGKFVVKCNHASGDNYIHSGKRPADLQEIKACVGSKFNQDTSALTAEWTYKNVERKIFAESYLETSSPCGLLDYKIYCFNGVPMFFQVHSFTAHNGSDNPDDVRNFQVFYDAEWNRQPFTHGYPGPTDKDFARPENFEEMERVAATLAQGFQFVRVDLYDIDGKIYPGEMTLYPFAGFEYFYPDNRWDRKLGDMIGKLW